MSAFDSARVVETRDRLRTRLDVLSQYDRVLREQLDALQSEDFDRFAQLGEERDLLGAQLVSVAEEADGRAHPLGLDESKSDLETARLIAEIHRQSSEVRDLNDRVMGTLESQRGLLRAEMDKVSAPVSDGAVRYMEAESGRGGSDRLDIVL